MPPRTPPPRSAVERARNEIRDEIKMAIRLLSAEMGPAPGARPLSEAKKVSMWGQRDPKVDYAQVASQLMTTGLPPDLLDPKTGLAIFKKYPEMAQMYAQPVAQEVAIPLAILAEYPLRLGLLEHLEDDPEAMVKEANRLDRAWQKQMGGGQAPPETGATSAPFAPPTDAAGAAAPTPSAPTALAPTLAMAGG